MNITDMSITNCTFAITHSRFLTSLNNYTSAQAAEAFTFLLQLKKVNKPACLEAGKLALIFRSSL
jgi:hypothetical protein